MDTIEDIKIIYSEYFNKNHQNNLIKEFYTIFITKDIAFIMEHIENDIHWQIVDQALILGKDQFAKALKQMTRINIKTIHIKNIIITGRTGVVNGIFHSANNRNYSFCDIYHFSNEGNDAKIQRISTYINSISLEVAQVCYH